MIGAGLAALGVGLFLIGSSSDSATARVKGGNVPINASATDARDITANNSPTVARSPVDEAVLAVVNRIDSPKFSCALHMSSDRGTTWRAAPIPFPAGEEQPPRCFAPDVAFGADGAMYVSFVTLAGAGNVPNAAWITSAPPGGGTLATPVRVADRHPFQLRLSADPTTPGRVYLSWLQASEVGNLALTPGNPIVTARSDDGGATWGRPVTVSPPARSRVVAPSTAVRPTGELYLLYLDVGDDALDYGGAHRGRGGEPYDGSWALVLARSSDRGQTWQETVVEPELVPTERFIVFFPPSPSLVVGQDQRVYVAFQNGRMDDADVDVWSSHDGGSTFGGPHRVNDTRPGDGTAQHLPKLAVAANGRVDVVYYDRRADPENVLSEVSLQSSFDHAKTFTPRLRLSDRPFDSRVGFGSERDLPDLGSRLGLVATEKWSLAVWADGRGGTQASGKQDLARALIAYAKPSPWWTVLRYVGLALVAAVALAAARLLLRSDHPGDR